MACTACKAVVMAHTGTEPTRMSCKAWELLVLPHGESLDLFLERTHHKRGVRRKNSTGHITHLVAALMATTST